MESYKICVCLGRKFPKEQVEPPPEIKEMFEYYADGDPIMSSEQFRRFLIEVQGDQNTSIDAAQRIVDEITKTKSKLLRISSFKTSLINATRNCLTFDDFMGYLLSSNLNSPIKCQVHQDMNFPLSHYFIYTGHNSYLTGNQITSKCSDVPIIEALQRGVRVIELDLWPNSAKDCVLVPHGKTLTSPVELTKCLTSIKEHAFCASPYPVILTLEDHLTPDLQSKVAQDIIQTFGDMLFYPKTEISKDFPSPEELKYKVIVSTKPPKEYLASKSFANNESDSQMGKVVDLEQEMVKNKNSNHTSENDHGEDSEVEFDDDSSHEKPPEYKKLITIPGVPRRELRESLKGDPNKACRLSWNEQTLAKATTSHGTDVVRFTQTNILRIFPKVTRFNSSNYDPLIGWLHGAQMVAFNMQGHGKRLWLMHGLFRANGGCGYVKKPDFLMNSSSDNQIFDPKSNLPIKTLLKVKIYMGDGWQADFKQTHFDLFSPPDFYVKIGIAGAPTDVVMKRTKVIQDRWIPHWNEEFSFHLTVPELALLRIEVYEYDNSDKDDFAGQTCLPVSELKPGIHAVPLYDYKGEKYDSVRLLMQFTMS